MIFSLITETYFNSFLIFDIDYDQFTMAASTNQIIFIDFAKSRDLYFHEINELFIDDFLDRIYFGGVIRY